MVEPTTAVISVALLTVKEDTALPPTVTALTLPNSVPVIVTVPPSQREEGVKDVIVGTGATVNDISSNDMYQGELFIVPKIPI